MQEELRDLSENENNQKWPFVTEEDIKTIPCFLNQTLIAIKAPHGTTLEVPDPDEAVDYPQRRYRIILRSAMGPIDLYFVGSGSKENQARGIINVESTRNEIEAQTQHAHQMCSDINSSQDFGGGLMKIVPTDVDNDADYWLLSDADASITDMWKTDSDVEWNRVNVLHTDFGMSDVCTPMPQTPSSRTIY